MNTTRKKLKILFLCTGNICRSPTAEGIFRKIIEKEKIEEIFIIDSAGTHDWHEGESPDKRSQKEASRNGVDISNIRARKLNNDDLNNFDYIIAMDRSHRTFVEKLSFQGKCKLLMSFNILNHGVDVPDPYYGKPKDFAEAFNIIEEGIISFISELKLNEIKKHN